VNLISIEYLSGWRSAADSCPSALRWAARVGFMRGID
jgi:hypothetical protein